MYGYVFYGLAVILFVLWIYLILKTNDPRAERILNAGFIIAQVIAEAFCSLSKIKYVN
jgi:hypothetical protein